MTDAGPEVDTWDPDLLGPAAEAQRLGGRYIVGEPLGAGGAGEVFAGEDTLTGRAVALKRLRSAGDPRAEREIAALRRLDLPGVVRLHEVVHDGRATWLVMERIRGGPFPGTLAADDAGVRWQTVRPVVLHLLETLVAVHAQGLVHRDLKPANVLVRPDGRPVILDFGLVRGSILGPTLTRVGGVVGTPRYLAPEQLTGEGVDARADLYAVGVMLFEVLAGRAPHPDADMSALWAARLGRDAPSLRGPCPGLPEVVVATVDAMLARRAEDRPPSAQAVLAALRGTRTTEHRLPWLGDEDGVALLVERLRAGRRARLGGPRGCGRTRTLQRVAARMADAGRAATWLVSGARPFESLGPDFVVPGDASAAGARAAARAWLAERSAAGVVLVDDPQGVDPWTRAVLAEVPGAVAEVVAPGEAADVEVRPLPAGALRALFHGPDEVVHIVEDASALLHRASLGVLQRVDAVARAWVRGGHARWEDGRLRMVRSDLDRLDARLGPAAPPRQVMDGLPGTLLEVLEWVQLARPCASTAVLAQVTGRPPWAVALEVEALVAAGAVVRDAEGRIEALASPSNRPLWRASRRRAAHRALGDALAGDREQALRHRLAAGAVAAAVPDAVAVARARLQAGRPRAAAAVVLQVLAQEAVDEPGLWLVLAEAALAAGSVELLADTGHRLRGASAAPPDLLRVVEGATAAARGDWEGAASAVALPVPPAPVAVLFGDVAMQVATERGEAAMQASVEALRGAASATPGLGARLPSWEGLLAFRRHDFGVAARAFEAAAAAEGSALRRLEALRQAALARLETGELEAAVAHARAARGVAETARHAHEEAMALTVERAALARGERPGPARPELVDAVSAVGLPSLEGRLAAVESWLALRAGDPALAARLARRAEERMRDAGIGDAVAHSRAIRVACGDITAAGEVLRASEDALACSRPDVRLDALGVLARAGRLPAAVAAQAGDVGAVAAELGTARRGVLSAVEAARLVRLVAEEV